MKRFRRHLIVALVAISGLTGICSVYVYGQQEKTGKRREFMRQKLDFSKSLLEGIVLEDYNSIISNAHKLKILSQAAEWEVPTIPDFEDYVPMTREFQQALDDMTKKAKARNLDGVTLAYFHVTSKCVSCHKAVRDPRASK
jgi:cytochrome c556